MELTNKQEYLMTYTKEEKELIEQRLEQVRLSKKANHSDCLTRDKIQQGLNTISQTCDCDFFNKPLKETPAVHSHPSQECGRDDKIEIISSFSSPTLIQLTEYTKHRVNNPRDVWAEDIINDLNKNGGKNGHN